MPNLSVGDQFGVNRTFIRGIGMTSIDLGADGAVAFLQDGAMIPRPSAQLAGFFDLEQVEVLRGPQGTLYGRGATAGVVNMITKKPTEVLNGYLSLTGGNYSAYTVEGAVGGPIAGDTVMGRIAARFDKRDGYGENLFTGKDIDDRDAMAVRGSLRFKPSDTLDITLIADYFEEDDDNYAFHYFGTTVVPEDGLAHNALGGETIFDYYAARGKKADLRNIYSDQDATNDRDGTGISALIDWQVNDAWIAQVRDGVARLQPFPARRPRQFRCRHVRPEQLHRRKHFVEPGLHAVRHGGECRLARRRELFQRRHAWRGQGAAHEPAACSSACRRISSTTGNYWQNGDVDIEAYGLFVQGKYDFTDQLALTLGARYNYEERTGTGSFIFDAVGANIPTDKSKDWDKVTPKVLLEYKTGNDGLLYAQYTEGFKSGVINVGSQNDVIDPEFVDAYEVGYKMPFADGRASLRTAVFYYDYTDLQVGFVGADSVVTTVNAASAENKGIELELLARFTEDLTGSFSATWLDAEYTEFVTGDYRQNFAPVDLSGNKLQNAPEYTLHAALDYSHPISESGSIVGHIDASYQDDVFFTEFNNADAVQEAYGIVNLSAGYEGGGGRWAITGWARNLTDEFVVSNNIITAPLYGSIRVGSLLPPRTYGLTLAYNF